MYLAKPGFPDSFTTSLRLAAKFETKAEAESKCGTGETVEEVDTVDYFKRG